MRNRTSISGWSVFALAALFITAASVPAAGAERFPERLVRIVLPYTAGAGADIHTRVWSQRLSTRWGVPVIVDNQPGASGSIGALTVAQSAPDGHTMMVTGESMFSAYMSAPPRYEPLKVLAPVARLITVPYALVARKDFSARSFAEFVQFARANPDKVTVATPGVGTPHWVLTQMLMNEMQLKLYHVPFKGSAALTQDLLGGRIDVAILPVPVARPLIAAGAQALAAGGSERTPATPGLPSFREVGAAALTQSDSWNGAFVAAATPREIVEKLSAELTTTLAEPETAAEITRLGFAVAPAGVDVFDPIARQTAARWQQTFKADRDRQP
jgi:tripartite-type tricarboxylate transporter receptor subunit TctC